MRLRALGAGAATPGRGGQRFGDVLERPALRVHREETRDQPAGAAMNKNLTLRMGNCNHRRYLPRLLDLVVSGVVDPTAFITRHERPTSAIDAYRSFDLREDGWLKTVLDVA